MNTTTEKKRTGPVRGCPSPAGQAGTPGLKEVFFVCTGAEGSRMLEEGLREAGRAVRSLREYGLDAAVTGAADLRAGDCTLCLCDGAGTAQALKRRRFAVAGWSHAGNREEQFRGIGYVLEEPDQVDRDSYEKIWQREKKLPWRILETERCLVREFRADDLEAVRDLYDEEARRWLEAPTGNTSREKDILRAYIRRIYGLYGYGHWAVILKETGELIGRMGYAVPKRSAFAPAGITEEDGVLGYLVGPQWRRRGFAEEVCRALIRYGLEELSFPRIAAEVRPGNTASEKMLRKLGFEAPDLPLNERGERTWVLG